MSETKLLAVSSIQVAPIAADGDVGTVFATLGNIYKETAEFTTEQDADIEHEYEEFDEPGEIVPGVKKTKLKWTITDFSTANLVKILGGTATGVAPDDTWTPPSTSQIIEMSVKITPKVGKVFTIPRVYLRANIDYKLQRSGIAKVVIEGRVLTPKKAGVGSYKLA